MKLTKAFLGYSSACCFLFLFDRITKYWALSLADRSLYVSDNVSMQLVFNRGISWGMFDSEHTLQFIVISSVIILLIGLFIGNTVLSFLKGENVFGQLLVIIGALSNLIDRFIYKGVIDFVVLSYHGYSFPVFNAADVFIVIGIGLILLRKNKIS